VYKLVTIEDTVAIPPTRMMEDVKKVCWEIILENLSKKPYSENVGIIILPLDVEPIGDGKITFGDPNVYQRVRIKALVYSPENKEVIDGFVTHIIDRVGLIVNLGVVDGLLHVSQIYDDRFLFSKTEVKGEKTKYYVRIGDKVRVRIVSISKNQSFTIPPLGIKDMRSLRPWRIGLSMRTPGLGKDEWRSSK